MFKFKKIIAIISVFAVVICFVVIPVSAEDVSVDFDGGLSLDSITVCIIDEEHGEVYAEESIIPNQASTGLPDTISFSIWVNANPLSTDSQYTLYIHFKAKDYIVSTANYCVGGFKVRMYDHVATFSPFASYPKAYRDGNGPTQYAKCSNSVESLLGNSFSTWDVDYSKNEFGTSYNDYSCYLPFKVNSNVQAFRIFISDVEFELVTESEAAQDREEEKATQQGEDSVNQIGSAIDNKSDGFINVLGGLVSAMSYDGTECAWTFPALKLPAISGVMPEYKLTEEKPIDFEFWVNKIPTNILNLVRAVCTIALIVYCFKELYDTISYVLTLKGGGNSNE